MLKRGLRYWYTLKYLKPVQIYGRARLKFARSRIDSGSPPPPRRQQSGDWGTSARRAPSMRGPDRFIFLSQTRSLASREDWNDSAAEKLWLYNLHYFDDLNASGAAGRHQWHEALLARWIAENPAGRGVGWEPYPTSLRIVNWIKWAISGNSLPDPVLNNLATQLRWLSGRLEWHLLGNHLFANAKALIFGGAFFSGKEAGGWLQTGRRIAERELHEQVLPDGGNFERSPMYHAIFLEDLLDLVNLSAAFPGTVPAAIVHGWRETAGRMLSWLAAMTHPDGAIALFNDAAFDIALAPAELAAYAERLGIERRSPGAGTALAITHFPDSGYIRLESPDAVALLDVAPVGPDYLPGHAHADTLSFELSVRGQRVVVNGGTSRYGLGQERQRERATASHSTVEVDGRDSSEVWGSFRVARRARPFGLRIANEKHRLSVECSHDGYRRLPGRPIHRRSWSMTEFALRVVDIVEGPHRGAVARFVLAPQITAEACGESDWVLKLGNGGIVRLSVEQGECALEDAHYAPQFGRVEKTACLTVALSGGKAATLIRWGADGADYG